MRGFPISPHRHEHPLYYLLIAFLWSNRGKKLFLKWNFSVFDWNQINIKMANALEIAITNHSLNHMKCLLHLNDSCVTIHRIRMGYIQYCYRNVHTIKIYALIICCFRLCQHFRMQIWWKRLGCILDRIDGGWSSIYHTPQLQAYVIWPIWGLIQCPKALNSMTWSGNWLSIVYGRW